MINDKLPAPSVCNICEAVPSVEGNVTLFSDKVPDKSNVPLIVAPLVAFNTPDVVTLPDPFGASVISVFAPLPIVKVPVTSFPVFNLKS